MSIRERIEDWIWMQRIRPDDPDLNRYILAVHWRHMSDQEAMNALEMDVRTFTRCRKAYRRLQEYMCN